MDYLYPSSRIKHDMLHAWISGTTVLLKEYTHKLHGRDIITKITSWTASLLVVQQIHKTYITWFSDFGVMKLRKYCQFVSQTLQNFFDEILQVKLTPQNRGKWSNFKRLTTWEDLNIFLTLFIDYKNAKF